MNDCDGSEYDDDVVVDDGACFCSSSSWINLSFLQCKDVNVVVDDDDDDDVVVEVPNDRENDLTVGVGGTSRNAATPQL